MLSVTLVHTVVVLQQSVYEKDYNLGNRHESGDNIGCGARGTAC